MTNRFQNDDQTKVTIRCDESLRDAYDETLGDQSRSKAIREHMRERAGEVESRDMPDNELLRSGLEAIQQAADPNGDIPTTVAKSRVAEATRVKTSDAVRVVIRPLDKDGYLDVPTRGQLRVTNMEGTA